MNVSGTQAQRTVLFAGAVLMGMIWFNSYKCAHAGSGKSQLACGGSTFARVWVAGILTLGLAFAADFAPQLVIPFSFAVVVGFAYRNPGLLSSFISNPTQAAKSPPPTATHTSTGIGGRF